MHLGIEIGGTKLQLGVGAGDGSPLAALERRDVDAAAGAAGILGQIEAAGRDLIERFPIERIGIGFGGPVHGSLGVVQKSHQIAGWDGFPLAEWCLKTLERPARLGNDCDVAALAEARFGAGRGARGVFFVTVGTGIGGGFVVDGEPYGSDRPAVAEIGHLRPGLSCAASNQTVESIAAGPGLAAGFIERLNRLPADARLQVDTELRERLGLIGASIQGRDIPRIRALRTTSTDAPLQAVTLADDAWKTAATALGWAIATVTTLLAPEVVVIGGGVSLSGDAFFEPVRAAADLYGFPPLRGTTRIVPAGLGEEVVVHGALALAGLPTK